MTPLVSVVMSVRNGERFVAEAIDSIIRQSYPLFEFIIVDDGSTDDSTQIVRSFAARDSRICLLPQEERGLVESLNRACRAAGGKYIARMDADDISMADRLSKQVEYLENNGYIGLLGGAVEIVDQEGKSLRTSVNPTRDQEIRSAFSYGSPFWHPTVMMRRNLFTSLGGYRKIVVDAEDCDLWLRMSDRCKMANLETVVLKYRLHPQQVTIQRCRTLALSSLAAHASAAARRQGQPDPLDRISEITPESLATMGVDQASQRRAIAARYLWTVRSMYDTGHYAAALGALALLRSSSDGRGADKRVLSDLSALESQLYWRERQIPKSLVSGLKAVLTRPLILGRPIKRVIHFGRPRYSTPRRSAAASD